jgi:hypothetical protein
MLLHPYNPTLRHLQHKQLSHPHLLRTKSLYLIIIILIVIIITITTLGRTTGRHLHL